MTFDLQNPHTVYVIAAYAVAGIFYGAMIVHTLLKCRVIKKMPEKNGTTR